MVPPLLRERVFRRYWGASTVSMFGDQVSSVAVPLTAVLVLHAGAADMGSLTAIQWLPSLLFGMHAGVWVDRRGMRRHTMILADLGRAVALATIPVCSALHVLTLLQMYAVTFVAGALSVLFTVSDGTLFVSIVPPERYVDGQSLIYGSRSLSFLGGPSVGGLLVEALTAPLAVVLDALSFLGSAFFLGRIRPVEPPSSDGTDGVTAGLKFIMRSPIMRAALTGVAVINFFNLMFNALFMLYAVRLLHVRPGVLGLVIGASAVGGMLGSVLCKRLTERLGVGLVHVAGCLVFTAPLALVPLAATAHGAAVLLMLFAAEFASGFGVMVLDISIAAISGVVIPDTMRSRVSGAFQAINYGTRPPGALLGGLLGSTLGLIPALWIAVVGGIVGALLLFPSPLPRFRMPTLRSWVSSPALRRSTSRSATLTEAREWREDAACVQNRRMRTIALEEHFWTPELAAPPGTGVLARAGGQQLDEALRDVDKARLADMDAVGIDVQVISHTQPAAQGMPGESGVAAARRANDYLAAAVSQHPERLAGFATLPTGSPEAAADELERVVRDLGFVGGMVNSTLGTDGAFLDDARFAPLLSRFESLDVPLYLHPAQPPAAMRALLYGGLPGPVAGALATNAWGWHAEAGLHALRMVVGGVFERHPGLRLIIGHCGEMIPFMMDRIDDMMPSSLTGLSGFPSEYFLRHVWVTTSGMFSLAPVLCAISVFGVDRVLFSVDFPFSANAAGRGLLDALPLSPVDKAKVAGLNAERVLGLA